MIHLIPASTRRRACIIGFTAATILSAPAAHAHEGCAAEGVWTVPGRGPIATREILGRAASAQVTLLGESHDNADHHRWELHTAAALAGLHPRLVLGFEMFPRRVQGVLDRWVAGELTEKEFLEQSDWSNVWGYDAGYYLPLFQFARLNRIPMVALNVERDLVRAVGAKGLAGVPPEQREGVSDPAPASESYLTRLFESYSQHPEKKTSPPSRSDPEFRRFVEAQLMWDRAMAQSLAAAAARDPDALIIGVMGARHVAHGDGVPHQLDNLDVKRVVSLLPWEHEADCGEFSVGLASAVYGLPYAPPEPAAPPPALLGIQIKGEIDGVRVISVGPGSIAEASGLQAQDLIIEAAGSPVKSPAELKAIVVRMTPGTWLPLKAKRVGELIELTAKFPARE